MASRYPWLMDSSLGAKSETWYKAVVEAAFQGGDQPYVGGMVG